MCVHVQLQVIYVNPFSSTKFDPPAALLREMKAINIQVWGWGGIHAQKTWAEHTLEDLEKSIVSWLAKLQTPLLDIQQRLSIYEQLAWRFKTWSVMLAELDPKFESKIHQGVYWTTWVQDILAHPELECSEWNRESILHVAVASFSVQRADIASKNEKRHELKSKHESLSSHQNDISCEVRVIRLGSLTLDMNEEKPNWFDLQKACEEVDPSHALWLQLDEAMGGFKIFSEPGHPWRHHHTGAAWKPWLMAYQKNGGTIERVDLQGTLEAFENVLEVFPERPIPASAWVSWALALSRKKEFLAPHLQERLLELHHLGTLGPISQEEQPDIIQLWMSVWSHLIHFHNQQASLDFLASWSTHLDQELFVTQMHEHLGQLSQSMEMRWNRASIASILLYEAQEGSVCWQTVMLEVIKHTSWLPSHWVVVPSTGAVAPAHLKERWSESSWSKSSWLDGFRQSALFIQGLKEPRASLQYVDWEAVSEQIQISRTLHAHLIESGQNLDDHVDVDVATPHKGVHAFPSKPRL